MHGDQSPIPTREELIESARELAPTLQERSKKAAELRRVPDETIEDFHRLGFFKVVQHQRFGGYEMDPSIIFDLQLELGRGCASSAWVYGVLNVHSWQLALFAPEAQDEVWGEDPKTLISSSYMPVAKTEWVDGGVKLSGRWSFSSGCDACQWVFLGGFVPNEEGKPPDMRTFLVPRADYEIIDNWYVSGLRGSGSKDVVVDGAFVPDHRMHKFSDGFRQQSPGNEINPSPVYKYPFGQIHVRSVSTPAVGAAFGALDSYVDFMKNKVSQATGGKAKESFTNSMVAAEATAVLDREVLTLRRNFRRDGRLSAEGREDPPRPTGPLPQRLGEGRSRIDGGRPAAVHRVRRSRGFRGPSPSTATSRTFTRFDSTTRTVPTPPGSNMGGVLFGQKSTDFFI